MSDSTPVVPVNDFQRALGGRAIATTVVTARDEDGPRGFLGLSAGHVCIDPPTLVVSVSRSTSALATIMRARHFAVNCLPRGCEKIADLFSGRGLVKGADRFEPHQWSTIQTGAPTFRNAVVVFDCVVDETFERPSVVIVLGRVVGLMDNTGAEPLISFRQGYL